MVSVVLDELLPWSSYVFWPNVRVVPVALTKALLDVVGEGEKDQRASSYCLRPKLIDRLNAWCLSRLKTMAGQQDRTRKAQAGTGKVVVLHERKSENRYKDILTLLLTQLAERGTIRVGREFTAGQYCTRSALVGSSPKCASRRDGRRVSNWGRSQDANVTHPGGCSGTRPSDSSVSHLAC